MTKINTILSWMLVTVFLLPLQQTFAKEPANLDTLKNKLIQYHDSNNYQRDFAKVIDKAMLYLKVRITSNPIKQKPAIVLDIDETSLSNYNHLLQDNFDSRKETMAAEQIKGVDTVIEPALTLYRYAKANHVAVFFITGRSEKCREATIHNLIAAGFFNWDGLFMRPDDYHPATAALFKTPARIQIEKQGYDIVLNMGDQASDLAGGHADKTFKLPNPYYIVS